MQLKKCLSLANNVKCFASTRAFVTSDQKKHQDGFGKSIFERASDTAERTVDSVRNQVTGNEKEDHEVNKDKAQNKPLNDTHVTYEDTS